MKKQELVDQFIESVKELPISDQELILEIAKGMIFVKTQLEKEVTK